MYAQKDGSAERTAFIEHSKKYLGTPYRYGGSTAAGMDCSGFIYTAARESLNLTLPRTAAGIHTYATAINDAERQPGDLVFFSSGGRVTHAGIFLGGRSFIHSASDGPYTGVIISTLDESYWKRTYIGSGRIIPSGSQYAGGEKKGSDSTPAAGASPPGGSNPGPDKTDSLLNLKLELSSSLMWNFFPGKGLGFNVRGGTVQFNAVYTGFEMQPGFGVELRFDPDIGVTQIPLLFSLSFGKGLRIYAGPIFTMGTPHMPGGTERLKPDMFPGIMGISWQTPSLNYKNFGVSLYQDISYTVFNSRGGSALPFTRAVTAGLVFSTGIRLQFSL
ncbi:MAG: C40 family peptidase [Spirochaetaceae bacterium]|nr:C40 family peptidase [Spirochaetaceae bacterium]